MKSMLDTIYSTVTNRNYFFRGGWGDRDGLEYLLKNDPVTIHARPVKDIQMKWEIEKTSNDVRIRNGSFLSPFAFEYKIGKRKVKIELPEESNIAYLQMILPKNFQPNTPLVLHYAATGDEGFSRRRITMALPLAKMGIGSIILENPFYGRRKPNLQKGVYINTFTEFLRMSRASTDEGIALLKYFKRQGHKNLGVTGISMGGYTALTTAARSNLDLAVAACVPCHSGAPVYLEGALSKACDWETLQSELSSQGINARDYMREILDQSDIRFFPKPKRSNAIIVIGALHDAYIPQYSTHIIKEHFPESTLEWIPTGHVGSLLFYAKKFREAIAQSFQKRN
jgi:dienelactone hydrolase